MIKFLEIIANSDSLNFNWINSLISFLITMVSVVIGGVISICIANIQLKKANRFTTLNNLKIQLSEDVDLIHNSLNIQIKILNDYIISLDEYSRTKAAEIYNEYFENYNFLNETKTRLSRNYEFMNKIFNNDYVGRFEFNKFNLNIELRLNYVFIKYESIFTRIRNLHLINQTSMQNEIFSIKSELYKLFDDKEQLKIVEEIFNVQLKETIEFLDQSIARLV